VPPTGTPASWRADPPRFAPAFTVPIDMDKAGPQE
jgi:hypothetical protein